MRIEVFVNEIKKQMSNGYEDAEIGGSVWLISPLKKTEAVKPIKEIGPGVEVCTYSVSKFDIVGDSLVETYFMGGGGGRACINQMKKERLGFLGYNADSHRLKGE